MHHSSSVGFFMIAQWHHMTSFIHFLLSSYDSHLLGMLYMQYCLTGCAESLFAGGILQKALPIPMHFCFSSNFSPYKPPTASWCVEGKYRLHYSTLRHQQWVEGAQQQYHPGFWHSMTAEAKDGEALPDTSDQTSFPDIASHYQTST